MATKDTNPLNYPRYVRGLRPQLPESLPAYIEDELEKVQNSLDNAAKTVFDELEAARAEIEDTNAKVDNIGEDSFLHPVEKLIVVREYADITAVYQNADARAATLGITTERTAATTAYNALTAYLGTLVPAWNDTSEATAIDRPTWDGTWDDVFASLEALWVAISAADAERASWPNVGGPNRPEDNATNGATIGGNLSGQFTSGNVPTYFAAASIGNAEIGGTLQTDNYVPGVSGWKMDKTGATLAEFNGVVLSRDQVIGSGQYNGGAVDVVNHGASFQALVDPVDFNPIEILYDTGITVAAWWDNRGPVGATARIAASPFVDGTFFNDSKWAVSADIVNVVRFSGASTIHLRFKLYGAYVENFDPLLIDWTVFKVT